MELKKYLDQLRALKGSDLFISVGVPPTVKSTGQMQPVGDTNLTRNDVEKLLDEVMDEEHKNELKAHKESNFAIHIEELGRFRVSAFQQRLMFGAVFRSIENKIPTVAELKLPSILEELSLTQRGLIIVSGATGSGKSSTLAAMIGYRNRHRKGHIITIEDPIEYIHEHDQCIITQREVGIDTESFEVALKNTLRQAPDVILIGEIRTKETMNYALAFAETGHLCLATLHANNANQALDRISTFFSSDYQRQMWMELSLNLKAIIAQQLIPTSNKEERVPAVEVLINTPVISEHLRKGEVHIIKEFIAKSNDLGMRTFDQDLFRLFEEGKINEDEALRYADSENELRLKIKLSSGKKPGSDLKGISILK